MISVDDMLHVVKIYEAQFLAAPAFVIAGKPVRMDHDDARDLTVKLTEMLNNKMQERISERAMSGTTDGVWSE